MVGQSGSMLPQGCPENYFPEPHTHTCVHCHHLCHAIYDTPLECEKFCPDYHPLTNPATSRQDDQTTSLFGMKQTFDTDVATTSAILTVAVSFLLVNIICYFRTKRNLKADADRRELEKLFPKHVVHQNKYHIFRDNDQLMISIQHNHDVCLKESSSIRGTHADMETGSMEFNLINDENIPHEHIAMVHVHHQQSISNVITNKSDKRHQHQTDLPQINTRKINIHSDAEINNNIETPANAPIQEDQSPVIRPWFFFKAHNNEIPQSIRHQSRIRIQDHQCEDEELSSLLPHDTSETIPTHKDQGDLKEYTHENTGELTSYLSLPISSSSWTPMYHNMESIDKNSGDEELSHHSLQDTLPKIRMQDQCNSSGYGSQDTDNPSPTVGTTVQSVGVSSVLNHLGSIRSDVNESLLSDPEHGTHSTMLPNVQTEIYLRSDSGDGVSHGKTYIDDAENETWGKVRLLYAKIKDLMPKYPWILNCSLCKEYVEVDLEGGSVDADIAMKRITDNIDKDLLNYLHFSSGAVSQISHHRFSVHGMEMN